MKILVLGNMANDGYAVVKELRKMNQDVDLAINKSDFGMALPQWEDANFSGNVNAFSFDHNIKSDWKKPEWVKEFDLYNTIPRKKFRFKKTQSRLELFKLIREYDFIEAHVPYCLFTQFSGRPYVVYDAGWIRYFPFGNTLRDKLARRGYSKAKKIIITNPDTFSISDSLNYIKKDRTVFCPFAIDCEKYKPINAQHIREKFVKQDEVLLFSPSRQIWSEKGNNKMIHAFAMYKKTHPKSKFIIVSWSVDSEASQNMAKSLGVFDDIIWIDPVPKSKLIEYYNACDIVLDQFVLGSWGTSTPEAMSCGKPVLIYYNGYVSKSFEHKPPMDSVFSVEEIAEYLSKLTNDTELRLSIGEQSREFIKKTHDSKIVAKKHLEIIKSCL